MESGGGSSDGPRLCGVNGLVALAIAGLHFAAANVRRQWHAPNLFEQIYGGALLQRPRRPSSLIKSRQQL